MGVCLWLPDHSRAFQFKGVLSEPLFFSQRLEVHILVVTDGQRTIENAYDELIADAHHMALRLVCQASHLTVWLFNGASCRAIAAVTGSPCSRQMADAVIKVRSIHPLRARLVRRNSLVWVPLRSMSPRVACRRHRYRLAIGVKEKAKKPSADGDECGADEQKCAIYQRKHSAGEHRNIVPGMIKRNSTYQPKHCRQQVNPSAADALHRLGTAILKAAGFFLATVAGEIVLQAFKPEIKALALMLRAFIGL